MTWEIRAGLAVKRTLDIAIALIGLTVLLPLLGLIALAIKVESPRDGVFFNDSVMGRGLSTFRMFKFRTMIPHRIEYTNRPEIGPDHPLVTRTGKILRGLKLDELPQLLNVLRGQMSLVGPRPMDPVRFAHATDFQRQRLLMRPGLTGWSQVNGNITWSWSERMEMDIWYVAYWSFWLDVRIIVSTIPVIVRGEAKTRFAARRITDSHYRLSRPGAARFGEAPTSDRVASEG